MGKSIKLLVGALALTAWQSASAVILTGEFSGVISSSQGYGLANNGANGETLTGTIWIDTEAAQLTDQCSQAEYNCSRDIDYNDKWIDISYSFLGNTYSPDSPQLTHSYDGVWAYDQYTSDNRDFLQVLEYDYESSSSNYAYDYAYVYIYDWVTDIISSGEVADLSTLSVNWQDSTPGDCNNNSGQCGYFHAQEYGNNIATNYINANLTSLTLNAASVPEPGTLALFGMGVFGLYFSRRNMKRS